MKLGWQNSIKRLTFLGLTMTTLLAVICHQSAKAGDSVQLLGSTEFPGTATDKSGLDNMLDHSVPHNRLGAFRRSNTPARMTFTTSSRTVDPAMAQPASPADFTRSN